MELLDVVDENGNCTGQILDRKKIHERNLLHWEVAILVVNDLGQTLLQKRSVNKKSNPNKWGACSGHVDAGENPVNAAIRELDEELGLKCQIDDLHVLKEKEVNMNTSNSAIRNYYYIFSNKKEDEFIIQSEELSEVKWYSIDEIIQKVKDGSNEFLIGEDKIYLLELLKKYLKDG